MPTREQRQQEAAKHIAFVKTVFGSETKESIANAVVYEDGEGRELELPEPAFESTATRVSSAFPATVVFDSQGKTGVIDTCSFTRPGGNYEDGAFGPEQALCADSNLYPILQGCKKTFFDGNRGYECSMLFTDRALFLPDVMFVRNGVMKKASVVAIAAPNRTRALENHRSERECDANLANRIEAQLRIAAAQGIETLVCGAFGCGSYGNDPAFVAQTYRTWIDAHPGAFKEVVFAVPRSAIEAFEAAFGAPQPAEEEPQATTEEEERDTEDWRTIDLPEGITLR